MDGRQVHHFAMRNLTFSTAPLVEKLLKKGVDPAVVNAWVELLSHPDAEERARFAFWFLEKADPLWLVEILHVMDLVDLPAGLRERAQQFRDDKGSRVR